MRPSIEYRPPHAKSGDPARRDGARRSRSTRRAGGRTPRYDPHRRPPRLRPTTRRPSTRRTSAYCRGGAPGAASRFDHLLLCGRPASARRPGADHLPRNGGPARRHQRAGRRGTKRSSPGSSPSWARRNDIRLHRRDLAKPPSSKQRASAGDWRTFASTSCGRGGSVRLGDPISETQGPFGPL